MTPTVLFVAPFALTATLRFARAVAQVPGSRTALITNQSAGDVHPSLREHLDGHWQVRNCFDPNELVEAAKGLVAQVGRPTQIIGTLEELQVPVAEARERLGLPGMGGEAARNFREKARMKDVFRRAGVPCAHHQRVTAAGSALAFAERVGFPLVVKPESGAGSRATFRVDDMASLREALAALRPSPERRLVVEEFVLGEEQSLETVSIDGRPAWHSLSHYLPTPLEVLRNPWMQWCVLVPREVDHPRYDDVRAVAGRALSALGMTTGLSHMEWFRRKDGSLAVSEIAMRPPGSQICTLHSVAHDFDFYAAWARLMVHGEFRIPEQRYAAGIAFFRGQGSGRVKAIHGLDRAQELLAELGVEVMDRSLPAPGQSKRKGYEGEGWAVVRHPETAVVQEGLRRLVATVRVELAS